MSQPATYYLTEWYASDGLPGSEPEQVATVADGSGNLYVAGVTLNAYEKYDLHLAKYDDDGDLLWSETFNLTDTTANVIVGQMILDNAGNPIIAGSVYNGSTNRYDALTLKFKLDCNPVAVSEVENSVARSLQLYPNPATQRLFIKSDLSETSAFVDIRIVDALGHSLNRIETLSPVDGGIDISSLPPSVYFIIATTKGNDQLFGRFIKMHH